MLSLSLAQQLKTADLRWQPRTHDLFAIPDRDMDAVVFVLSDMMAYLAKLRGRPIVAFAGATEWALDHIWVDKVVWLPTEAQLRQEIADRLPANQTFSLQRTVKGYQCQFSLNELSHTFDATTASDAYALALLFLLK
ncbi:MAG: pilus assembly protein CpaE [Chloroflexota bacterium]